MQRTSLKHQPCSIARTLDAVGEWWSLLILRNVFLGIRRFDALRGQLGISRKVLTARLNALVRAGILERRPYQDAPRRHEYRLTPMGVDLFPILMALSRWGDRWLAGDDGAPLEFVHTRCGRAAATLRCAHCGDELGAHNVRPRPGPGAPPGYAEALEKRAGRAIFLP